MHHPRLVIQPPDNDDASRVSSRARRLRMARLCRLSAAFDEEEQGRLFRRFDWRLRRVCVEQLYRYEEV